MTLLSGVGLPAHGAVTDSPPPFRAPAGDPLARSEFEALRQRYIQAQRAHRRGDLNAARALYRELEGDYTPMAGPIRRALAAIALRQHRYKDAQTWAEALLAGEGVEVAQLPLKPGQAKASGLSIGSMAAWGLTYRGEALMALGRPQVAAASFDAALIARGRGMPGRARLHYQMARCHERLGETGPAYRHYLLAERAAAGNSWGKEAADAIARLTPVMGYEDRRVAELLGAEIVSDLIAAGREEEALSRIDDVMATCELPEVRQELQLARRLCEARLAEPDEGVQLLHRLTYTPHLTGSQYWSIVHNLQALLAKQRDHEARVNILRRYLATFPGAEESIQARFILADILSDRGEADEAQALYAEIVRLYPQHALSDDARWALAWARIREGDLAGAFPVLTDHAVTVVPGSRAEARAVYWLGRAAEARGRNLLARWLWLDVTRRFPDTYYGVMAQWRSGTGVPGAIVAPRQTQLPTSFPVLKVSPMADGGAIIAGEDSWVVGRSLLFPGFIELLGGVADSSVAQILARAMETALMGDIKGASIALADARADRRTGPQALLILSSFYHSIGYMQSGMRVGHSHLSRAPAQGLHGPRQRRWAMAYPWPFLDHFIREGWRQGLQPALMAGMAQQESGFWPTARSSAGARGLLQLMPRTARGVAASLGLGRPALPELYKPTTNTRLGAAYLRDMLDTFGGSVPRALAAYNAGPGAVQRWLRKLGEDVDDDILIEEIPYTETRDYVRVVLRNYAGYRAVYPGLLYSPSAFPKAPPPRRPSAAPAARRDSAGDDEEHGRASAAPQELPPDPDEPGGLFGPGGALDF